MRAERPPGGERDPLPADVSFVQAASFSFTFLTAWRCDACARLERGDDVLVIAAGSGVGQAAIQIACLHGARVFATVGSDEKIAPARALGACEVIHHHRQDIAAEILRLTDRRGVDVVVEHVGEATWQKSVRALARGGRLVTCGATTGATGVLNLRALFAKQLTIQGSFMGTKAELLRATPLFLDGRLTPVVDRTYPLADAVLAHRRLEESEQSQDRPRGLSTPRQSLSTLERRPRPADTNSYVRIPRGEAPRPGRADAVGRGGHPRLFLSLGVDGCPCGA